MSEIGQQKSIRQLPRGKLEDIKKKFEDGDSSSNTGKSDRPMPPARPAQPPSRVKSPVRKLSGWQQPGLATPERLPQSLAHAGVEAIGSHSEQNSPARYGLRPPKPAVRSSYQISSAAELTSEDNSPRGSLQTNAEAGDNLSDQYAKINKVKIDIDYSPRKVVFSSPDKADLDVPMRETVRRGNVERRKTISAGEAENGSLEIGNISVAERMKLFDAGKKDKPLLPQKPESVKRMHSMRTQKELDCEQNKLVSLILNDNSSGENSYQPPWDLSKNSNLEKLKKAQPAPVSSSSSPLKINASSNKTHSVISSENTSSSSSCTAKSFLPPKPPFPVAVLRKPEKSELLSSNIHSKTELSEVNSDFSKPPPTGPPPKPPRTHAHDDYVKVRVTASQIFDTQLASSSSTQVPQRKTLHVTESESPGKPQRETDILSVKDRISRIQQNVEPVASAPLSLPSVTFLTQPRAPAPSRPPPPRKRPSSGDHNGLATQLDIAGPVIVPVFPNSHHLADKQWSDLYGPHSRQLPPEPESGRSSLQRFPLRKSYSSECLHSSKSSSLNGDLDDYEAMNAMMNTSYCENQHYEAVIDQEGYAVPNVFKKLPSRQRHSVKEEVVADSSGAFLTRIKGFSGDSLAGKPEAKVTSTQEQNLEKVNKKKMTMVRQKINQAYADVNIALGGAVEINEGGWQIVDPEQESNEPSVDPTVLKKRIDYCTSVRLKSATHLRQANEYQSGIYPQLFEYCLVVGLQPLVEVVGYEPYVVYKFPENVTSNISVPSFCFPDASIFKPGSVTAISESYSFVMTNADGSKVYGYCRRMQPPDSSLPEVICIITPVDSFNMYNELLGEIEARRRQSLDLASELIAASFGRPLPKPGKSCQIRTLDVNGDMETIVLNRPSDNRPDNVNYESPLFYLGTEKLVKVFSTMLMERRILLCSSNLSVLTQTVHALSALLYPFQWQHVYIPLLPAEMLDVLCAPVPYIVGVLSVFLPKALKLDLEEVFIVDLDKKAVVKSQGDESTILPKAVQKALKTAINMCKVDAEACNVQWLMVAEAFIRVFIETVGHFNNHVSTQQDGSRVFQKESFIQDVASKDVREFLSWFTETQMFEVFIVNHVEKSELGTHDLFLQRLQEFKESKAESSKHKGLGAKVKNIGKAIRTKLQAST